MTVRLRELREVFPEAAAIIERLPDWCQEGLVVVADVMDDTPYFAVLQDGAPSIPADPGIYQTLSELRAHLVKHHPRECAELMAWARGNDLYDIHSGDGAAAAPLYHTPEGMVDGTADVVRPEELRLPSMIDGTAEVVDEHD